MEKTIDILLNCLTVVALILLAIYSEAARDWIRFCLLIMAAFFVARPIKNWWIEKRIACEINQSKEEAEKTYENLKPEISQRVEELFTEGARYIRDRQFDRLKLIFPELKELTEQLLKLGEESPDERTN